MRKPRKIPVRKPRKAPQAKAAPKPRLVNQPTAAPTRKVRWGAYGGAIASVTAAPLVADDLAAIFTWAWNGLVPGYPLPNEIAASIAGSLIGVLAYFGTAYSTKAEADDA